MGGSSHWPVARGCGDVEPLAGLGKVFRGTVGDDMTNGRLLARGLVALLGAALLGCGADAWSGVQEIPCPTDPADPLFDNEWCVAIREHCCAITDPADPEWIDERCIRARKNCPAPDAGPPGSEPQSCKGVCIANAPDGFDAPQPFWIGPNDGSAPLACPDDIGSFGARAYADLDVSPYSCPTCVCSDIKGSCSPRPGQMTVRAGACSEAQPYASDFNEPEGWDGSCTSAKTIPAGAECPAGSGVLCAQSVYVSALPDPVEGCEPIPLPTPHATAGTSWGRVALSCSASRAGPDYSCGIEPLTCDWELPKGTEWRHCVRAEGVRACPTEGAYSAERFVVHPLDAIKDERGCTVCQCKAAGGACFATFSVYEDEACTALISANPWTSNDILCANVFPEGLPIGSKEITELQYVPGTCQPLGGGAYGTAEPADARAITWC
jgi:hypothetical protein